MAPPLKALLAGFWLISSCLAAQPIYRVVDENGNVIYTDQKPTDEAEPLQLPDLSVISQTAPLVDTLIENEPSSPSVEPFRMRIAEPANGSLISSPEGRIDVRLESNLDIPPAAQLVVFVNDQPQAPVRELELSLTNLPPGRHQLQAQLQSPSGRKLAESEAVVVQLNTAGAD